MIYYLTFLYHSRGDCLSNFVPPPNLPKELRNILDLVAKDKRLRITKAEKEAWDNCVQFFWQNMLGLILLPCKNEQRGSLGIKIKSSANASG